MLRVLQTASALAPAPAITIEAARPTMRSVDTSNRSKQNARAQSSWHTFAAIKNGAAALSAAGLCKNQLWNYPSFFWAL